MPGNSRRKSRKKPKINPKYLPKSLSPRDRRRQLRSIQSHSIEPRPKVKYQKKKSQWTLKFHRKYGADKDVKWVGRHLLHPGGIERILHKGRGAYASSGSRPNQNLHSWAMARLHSVLMGGPARRVDRKIWDEFRIRKKKKRSSKLSKLSKLAGGRQRNIVSVKFTKAPHPNKKWTATFYDADKRRVKTTHFGAAGYSDYTKHRDAARKQRYLIRHRRNESWQKFWSPGALSRYVLWNKPTLQDSIRDYKKRFRLQ